MHQLRVLDLSKNQISSVQPAAFSGLSLNLLSLTDNTQLSLSRGVFRNAQVYHFAARNCDLRELDYDTIADAKPRQLSLSQNQISWLDPSFAQLIRPSLSPKQGWGYIDLTDNPLNCNCQLIWLPKLIEEQMYFLHRSSALVRPLNARDEEDVSTESPIKLMHQINLTCASPPFLAGKLLPRSWNFFCPVPKVVGVDVSLPTASADFAQLTCIGRGQPSPSIAWTYRVQGQKVQRILDPQAQQNIYDSSFGDEYGANSGENSIHHMSERRLALNVSLNGPPVKNFTCTVWNDDNLQFSSRDQRRPFKSNTVPDTNAKDSMSYRMHEVTVRIHGLKNAYKSVADERISGAFQQKSADSSVNQTELSRSTTPTSNSVANSDRTGVYDYLFTERFSLLQLLGAIIGTFVVTVFLLYLATHLLTHFCNFTQIPLKEFPPSHIRIKRNLFKRPRKADGGLICSVSKGDFLSQANAGERALLTESNLTKAGNCDSAFSVMSATTSSIPGPSTIPVRQQNLPQTVLLSGLPAPTQTNRSSTPPPNPAYWPMPEYTYTGTGSHEYDVPRPLEPLIAHKTLPRSDLTDTHTLNPHASQPFLNLTSPSFISMSSGGHVNFHGGGENGPSTTGFNFSPTVPTFIQPWSPRPELPLLSPLLTWGPHGGGSAQNGVSFQNHLINGSCAQYPSSQSMIYSGDYPAYLQTRPYPHHHHHQVQPLLELMANSTNKPPVLSTGEENELKTPGSMKKTDGAGNSIVEVNRMSSASRS
ncbi:unnamed protein product [Calicophoron daubneyi]|uniref:Ig-like domain-containing protein n=1 Tax=Calicophoron daubneyi TaxID=300641 RepID=A0AAV2TCR0_CALDB